MKFQKLLLFASLLITAGLSAMQPGPDFEDSDYPSSESESDIEETPVITKREADRPFVLPKQPTDQPLATIRSEGGYDVQPFYGTGLAPLQKEQPLEEAGEYTEKPRAYPALPQNLFEEPTTAPVVRSNTDRSLVLPKQTTIPSTVKPLPTVQSQGDYDKQPWYGVGLATLKGKDIRPYPVRANDYDRPMRWKDAIPAPAALEMEKPALKYTTRPQSPVTVVEPQAGAPAPEEPMSAGSFYSRSQKPSQQLPVTIVQPQQPAPQAPAITVQPMTSTASQALIPAERFYSAPQKQAPKLPVTILDNVPDKPLRLPAQTSAPSTMQPISQGDYDVQPKSRTAAPVFGSMQKPTITTKPVVAKPTPQLPVVSAQQPAAYTAHPVSPVTVSQPAAPAPQPVVSPQPAAQSTGIIAMLLGRARQHSEFEIAITNSSNETYRLEHNGQSLALAPGQRQQINLENLPTKALQPIVRTRIVAGREVSRTSTQRTYDAQPIKLVNVANNQQYVLALTRNVNAKGQITIAATIGQGPNLIRTKSLTFSPPAAGQRVYYVINVNLQGEGLNQTTFDITPTLAQ